MASGQNPILAEMIREEMHRQWLRDERRREERWQETLREQAAEDDRRLKQVERRSAGTLPNGTAPAAVGQRQLPSPVEVDPWQTLCAANGGRGLFSDDPEEIRAYLRSRRNRR